MELEGQKPIIATTDARTYDNTVSYAWMRRTIEKGDRPVLVLFGTGYGMTKETIQSFWIACGAKHGGLKNNRPEGKRLL